MAIQNGIKQSRIIIKEQGVKQDGTGQAGYRLPLTGATCGRLSRFPVPMTRAACTTYLYF